MYDEALQPRFNSLVPIFPQAQTIPTITTQPQAVSVTSGSALSLEVIASVWLAYQWLKNGIAITGANSSSYTIPAPLLPMPRLQRQHQNLKGSVASASATVTIIQQPRCSSSAHVGWQ